MGLNGVELLTKTKTFDVGKAIVHKDLEMGLSLGITGTPVIILIRRGVQHRVSSLTELDFMFTGK
jgi:protein-disulfide isomerase